jgi:hypothetical protein
MLKLISMRPRPFAMTLCLLAVTIVLGLAVRFAPLHLPPFIVKYGGSTLWAINLYWLVSALLPRRTLLGVASITCALAAAIEFLKLYHSPSLDSFRLTLPGILLLGRFFSFWDIVAYWLAIVLAALLDNAIRRRLSTLSTIQ